MRTEVYRGIGLMCGTSQDGLDIADVSFFFDKDLQRWTFSLEGGETIALPEGMAERLGSARTASAEELARLDIEMGRFSGEAVLAYMNRSSSTADFVASHGVTIFHNPSEGYSTQIGNGAEIATRSGLQTICDFRQSDVSKGGQGAPLVPSVDPMLFSDYSATLNLGGFANIARWSQAVEGHDLGPCNVLLNHLAREGGLRYDAQGQWAKSGTVIPPLLTSFESLWSSIDDRGSLGAEWFEELVLPLLEEVKEASIADRMRTAVAFVVNTIGRDLGDQERVLVTGGGAHNDFLIDQLKQQSSAQLVIPEPALIDLKESVCFAFLGLLRLQRRPNIKGSSTGAKRDSIGGAIYLP